MAEYLIQESTLTEIADAVRAKTKKTNSILVSNLADEIDCISTGVELNFEVVGGITEPENPKENTIWINTDIEISDYVFSITQPSNPNEGMVFLFTSIDSQLKFNAIPDNVVEVYPLFASQYINGSWQSKNFKIYQNGEWKNFWDGVVYDAGNENTKYTGGIGLYHGTTGGYGAPTASATKNTSDIKLTATRGAVDGASVYAFMYTKNKIDLTPFTTLTAKLSSVGTQAYICVLAAAPTDAYGSNLAEKRVTSAGTYDLNISNVDAGHVCVRVHGYPGSNTSSNTYVTVSKLSLS